MSWSNGNLFTFLKSPQDPDLQGKSVMYHSAYPSEAPLFFGSRITSREVDVAGGFFIYLSHSSISAFSPLWMSFFDWILKHLWWTLYLSRLLTFPSLWSRRIHHLSGLHQHHTRIVQHRRTCMLKDKAMWKVCTESGEFVYYNLMQPLQSSWGKGCHFQRQMGNARKGAQTKKKIMDLFTTDIWVYITYYCLILSEYFF